MNIDYLMIRKVASELERELVGGRVWGSLRVGTYDLYLNLDGGRWVLISCHPIFHRLHRSEQRPDLDGTEWETQHLRKAVVKRIQAEGKDRIIRWTLQRQDDIGTTRSYVLVVELTGRNSNVILLNGDTGNILNSLRRVTARISRVRQILPGLGYRPPPLPDRVNPDTDSFEAFEARLVTCAEQSLVHALMSTIAGIGRSTAQQCAYLAGLAPDTVVGEVTADQRIGLWGVLRSLYASSEDTSGAFVVLDEHGRAMEAVPFDPVGLPPGRKRFCHTAGEAVESLYRDRVAEERERKQRRELERTLMRRVEATRRKLEALRRDLEKAEKADLFRKKGELLMAYLYRVRPGQREIVLPTFEDPSETLAISLDPRLSPAENAQRYFARYRKAVEGRATLQHWVQKTKKDLQGIENDQKQLLESKAGKDLAPLRNRLIQRGYLKKHPMTGNPRERSTKNKPSITPRRYLTSEGWTVWVGRDDRENDILTHRVAAQDDLWFHAHGCPGSHVVLRRESRKNEPSKHTLKEAAGLAAYWSKARGAKTVPVQYTLVKYVRKPKGAKPGLAVIEREKTLFVEPKLLPRADETEEKEGDGGYRISNKEGRGVSP